MKLAVAAVRLTPFCDARLGAGVADGSSGTTLPWWIAPVRRIASKSVVLPLEWARSAMHRGPRGLRRLVHSPPPCLEPARIGSATAVPPKAAIWQAGRRKKRRCGAMWLNRTVDTLSSVCRALCGNSAGIGAGSAPPGGSAGLVEQDQTSSQRHGKRSISTRSSPARCNGNALKNGDHDTGGGGRSRCFGQLPGLRFALSSTTRRRLGNATERLRFSRGLERLSAEVTARWRHRLSAGLRNSDKPSDAGWSRCRVRQAQTPCADAHRVSFDASPSRSLLPLKYP
jgi:hypothetical protein